MHIVPRRVRDAPSAPPPASYEAYVLADQDTQDGGKSVGAVTVTDKLVEEQCSRWKLEKEYEEYQKANPSRTALKQDATDICIFELQQEIEEL